jgi:hypothetical protein
MTKHEGAVMYYSRQLKSLRSQTSFTRRLDKLSEVGQLSEKL